MSVRKGEVRDHVESRWVVVSGDDTSKGLAWIVPLCVDTVERGVDIFVVPTHASDPVAGEMLLMDLTPVPPELLGPPVGTLVRATVAAIDAGLRGMFDL